MLENVEKIFDSHPEAMSLIEGNTGLAAVNDHKVLAVFIAAHLGMVETTPEEAKEIDTVMKTLANTGFADGSMGSVMSEEDTMEYL